MDQLDMEIGIDDLLRQQIEAEAVQARIAAQILEMQRNGKQLAVEQVEELIQKYKLTFEDIPTFVHQLANNKKRKQYTFKNQKEYLNPSTKETWNGVGRKPDWLKFCDNPEEFLVTKGDQQ